jgi:hypothetical protein
MVAVALNHASNYDGVLRSQFFYASMKLGATASELRDIAKRIDPLLVPPQETAKDSLVHALENLLEVYTNPGPHDDRKSFIKAAKDALKRAED